jgi:hypothetical protein
VEEFLEWFPGIGREQAKAILEHAGFVRSETIVSSPETMPTARLSIVFPFQTVS